MTEHYCEVYFRIILEKSIGKLVLSCMCSHKNQNPTTYKNY